MDFDLNICSVTVKEIDREMIKLLKKALGYDL